jgi:hypothetical protein
MNNEPLEIQGCYERRLPAMWRDMRYALADRLRQWRLRRVYRLLGALEGDSNIVAHIRSEMPDSDDEMQTAMRDHLIRMGQLFAAEGHSGFSAAYATSCLNKLLRFEPLGPLTGEDSEWMEVYREDDGTPVYQNLRCSHVFKQGDRAYDINGRVFREPSGSCYISSDSRVDVTFPYTPTTEYVDVEGHPDD